MARHDKAGIITKTHLGQGFYNCNHPFAKDVIKHNIRAKIGDMQAAH